MDTHTTFPYDGSLLEKITLLDLNEQGQAIVLRYVEITRHLQEIRQLFCLFRYHLSALLATYELTSSDKIVRRTPYKGDFDDRMEINALTISYISAGKTLLDAMEVCAKETYGEKAAKEKYGALASQVYDSSFPYRFLVNLRNYVQHGHLPVSQQGERFCFDLEQILNTPHFSHKSEMAGVMERFTNEILGKCKSQPLHMFTVTVAEYTVCLANVYQLFWSAICEGFSTYRHQFGELLAAHPESLVHLDNAYDHWFFYLVEDSHLHCLDTHAEPAELVDAFAREAKTFYENETLAFEKLMDGMNFVKL